MFRAGCHSPVIQGPEWSRSSHLGMLGSAV
jgi:hypothetical protein